MTTCHEPMGDESGRWWTIEHTADLAIEVEAGSPSALFVTAAHGLTGLLLGEEAGECEVRGEVATWRELALEADDRETLLVDWLRELLYLQMSDELLLTGAEVRRIDERSLRARAGLAPASTVGRVERELKGVTYHDLEVSRRDGGWYARIVFDV